MAYKLRWQIELLFKEWKSYANLHAFDTGKSEIAEGLIWAAIAAATVKRHMAQHLTQVHIPTRKVVMCAHHVLGAIVEVLIDGGRLRRGHRPIFNNLSVPDFPGQKDTLDMSAPS